MTAPQDTAAREWFTAAELAEMGLPALPGTTRGIAMMAKREDWDHPAAEGRTWRRRQGRGGGVEYHLSTLPMAARTALLLRLANALPAEAPTPKARLGREELWAWYDRQTTKKKEEAKRRLQVLQAVEAAQRNGMTKVAAVQLVCSRMGIAPSGYYRWEALVKDVDRTDRLAALVPRHAGSAGSEAECSPEAWAWLRAAYLRPEQPNFADCYRQLLRVAAEQDPPWTVPSERTLFRRMQALPLTTRVFLRKGADALKAMLPAQQRDHSVFHALQAVNTDDHRMDVFVRWEDGTVGRPHLVGVQDIYSGMILGWRIDRSENTHAIRLAIGDVVEEFGIPEIFWFDNTRAAANKAITGGQPNRYRFKVKEEDPPGLIEMLDAEVRFAQPYHGQAKPIERAFRDAAQDWAKDLRFAGAYTGNSPTAKPANYASASIPIVTFVEVIAERIEEHNTRIGRRSPVCAGRSFREAFDESYRGARERGLIRRATERQRHLFLLQAEPATIRGDKPMLHLHGNRYFAPFMLQLAGQKVVARFDPDALHDDIHVYGLDGRYLGTAACEAPVGFADTAQARAAARRRKALFRAHRDLALMEREMTLEQAAALLPKIDKAAGPAPETKVVKGLFTAGNAALKPRPAPELQDGLPEHQAEQTAALLKFYPVPRTGKD